MFVLLLVFVVETLKLIHTVSHLVMDLRGMTYNIPYYVPMCRCQTLYWNANLFKTAFFNSSFWKKIIIIKTGKIIILIEMIIFYNFNYKTSITIMYKTEYFTLYIIILCIYIYTLLNIK